MSVAILEKQAFWVQVFAAANSRQLAELDAFLLSSFSRVSCFKPAERASVHLTYRWVF
jgi:hypothetical protein